MSRIKGKHTRPEMLVRKYLYKNGLRYRLHSSLLPGKPDIVLRRLKTIVDVRGCFWHGHKNCKFGDQVTTESEGVRERVKSAIARDKRNTRVWRALGWKVIVLWDSCQLETRKKTSYKRLIVLNRTLEKLENVRDSSN